MPFYEKDQWSPPCHYRKKCENCGVNIVDTIRWKDGVCTIEGGRQNTRQEQYKAMLSIDDGWGFFCGAKCRDEGLEEAKILMLDEPVSAGDVFAVMGRETGLIVIKEIADDTCSRRHTSSFPVVELNETTIRNAVRRMRASAESSKRSQRSSVKRGKGAE